MLYDLNIAWSPTTSADDLTRTLRFSASLGYDVVALNHTISPPIPPQVTNPIPEFPPSSSSSSTDNNKNANKQNTSPPLPTVLRRATLLFSDPSQQHRIPQLASTYDMLALRPQTEKAFQAACLNVLEASLISLDLSSRLPFYFRPKPCMAAINRGVRFEVCYSQVLASPSSSSSSSAAPPPDARARATFIGNVTQLVRATRGRGIVLSSEARGVLGLRAPADVVNLLHVWGLPRERAAEALGPAPRGVVVNEGIKRTGFRGVVDIVGVAAREGQQPPPKRGDAGASLAAAAGGKKRKNGSDGENVEAGSTGANIPTAAAGAAAVEGDEQQQQQQQPPPPLSKRQAKKLKAALRKKHVSGDDEQKQA
ncbi:RNase P subunit p30-domain-containing protein [Biscogniauxia mediterranea]|nr:RNase P subunit p30-domain-containing protein [Biscogniauxia mediterranea]